jgi:hypothetical protein
MKLRVADLQPNPFRRIKEYQIQPEKVEMLVNSIKETFFWDNLIARPSPDDNEKYELAYGHHRLVALKKLKMETIDIPVKPLTDVQMLKIMADENAEEYKMSPSAVNETVLAVKEYLEGQIKGKEYKEVTADKSIGHLFRGVGENHFSRLQSEGVGREIITEFLGKNWKEWMVQEALKQIQPDTGFNREAAEKLGSINAARTFRQAATTYKVPVEKQVALAEKLKDASTKEVFRAVKAAAPKKDSRENRLLAEAEDIITSIEKQMISLTNKLDNFNVFARKEKFSSLQGVQKLFTYSAFEDLLRALKQYDEIINPNIKTTKMIGRNI